MCDVERCKRSRCRTQSLPLSAASSTADWLSADLNALADASGRWPKPPKRTATQHVAASYFECTPLFFGGVVAKGRQGFEADYQVGFPLRIDSDVRGLVARGFQAQRCVALELQWIGRDA